MTAQFSFVDKRRGDVWLSIERVGEFVARCKDEAAAAFRLRREARARTAEAIEEAGVRRRFLAEQRADDRAIARFWRRFKTKIRKTAERQLAPKRRKPNSGTGRSRSPAGQVRLPSYGGPVIDSMGRRGVYMDVHYFGARRARVGVARRLVVYITRDEALEMDGAGAPIILSNVGGDPAEQAMAFDLVEALNRAAQDDAKIVFSMTVNLPHDISADARRDILARFCEEAFAAHDLPYSASAHLPSKDGDQRNNHGHIIFALRPLQHVGDHEWDAGREVRTEFDTKERFAFYRKLFAEVMTQVTREQGKQRSYTHLSNAARGLKNKPLKPLGPAKTEAVRRGEYVPDNEYNRAEITRGEMLLREDRSRRRLVRQEQRIAELRSVHAAMIAPLAPLEVSPLATAITMPLLRQERPPEPHLAIPLQSMAKNDPGIARPHAVVRDREGPTMVGPILHPALELMAAVIAKSVAVPGDTLVHAKAAALASSQDRPTVAGRMDTVSRMEQPVKATRVSVMAPPQSRTITRSMVSPPIGRALADAHRIGFSRPKSAVAAAVMPVPLAQAPIDANRAPMPGRDALLTDEPFAMFDAAEPVALKERVPSAKSEEPVTAVDMAELMRLHDQAVQRAAERAKAKARKRRGPGIGHSGVGGNGLGG